ncbi:DNA primase [bacterium]|nr:DNA primase [bacterium]
MKRIHTETVDAVKAYDDIVGVISDYMPLKKRGRNHVGLCPFHSEKSPSFYVSPEKKLYHCFGCQESGDIISFVMKMDNLDFIESIRVIAQKAGIEIQEMEVTEKDKEKTEERSQLLDLLFETREYFKGALKQHPKAFEYLIARGVSEASIDAFHLGYSPAETNPLKDHLANKGFSPDQLIQSGLFSEQDSGRISTPFYDRVMFPIIDHHGRTLGFGGRILVAKNNSPKYINSPDSPTFNKSRTLYALDLAKSPIRKNKVALVMEGYMDVIMAHQYGFKNAVASMGTALTSSQANLLKRHAPAVILAMDADEAGQTAIERSYEVLQQAEMKVSVLNLESKDPADELIENGEINFQDKLDNALHMIPFKFQRLKSKTDTSKIENVSALMESLLPIIKAESDGIVQDHYISEIAKELQIDKDQIFAKLNRAPKTKRRPVFAKPIQQTEKIKKLEDLLLYIMATDKASRKKILEALTIDDWTQENSKVLVQSMQNTDAIDQDLLAVIDIPEHKSKLTRVLVEGSALFGSIRSISEECQKSILALKKYHTGQQIGEIKQQLKEQGLDEAKQHELLHQLNNLMNINQN